ncbi:DUF6289 family protein [Dyella lutea]|uniref:DUF6289 family protein n=1 Tax=Dyella lutea TaxID=2950441 RepID=A0ABT1FBD4_9GAMM|nr:DUF6289 family protein [Dyella lutea]MCP1374680.1 DUF6289 family protein [Dyella lutea]
MDEISMMLNKTLILGLIALSALTGSAIAVSAPSYDIDTVYFSDAAKTNMVGESELYCTGKHDHWGQTTQYYTVEKFACGGAGPCSPIGCMSASIKSSGALKQSHLE